MTYCKWWHSSIRPLGRSSLPCPATPCPPSSHALSYLLSPVLPGQPYPTYPALPCHVLSCFAQSCPIHSCQPSLACPNLLCPVLSNLNLAILFKLYFTMFLPSLSCLGPHCLSLSCYAPPTITYLSLLYPVVYPTILYSTHCTPFLPSSPGTFLSSTPSRSTQPLPYPG